MSNLKNQLIRLGSTNPELQKHLKPILSYLDGEYGDQSKNRAFYPEDSSHAGKEAQRPILDTLHASTSVKGNTLYLQPNTVYFYAAPTPYKVVVTKITEDRVSYYSIDEDSGYASKESKPRAHLEQMLFMGSQDWLRHGGIKEDPLLAKHLKQLFSGKPVPAAQVNVYAYLRGEEVVTVLVQALDPTDLSYYRRLKDYGVVSLLDSEKGLIEVDLPRKDVSDLRKDVMFDVLKVG